MVAENARGIHWSRNCELASPTGRWLTSYTANLSRIGQRLVDTDTIRRELSRFQPAEERDEYLLEHLGPQYPWYWSAGVLAAFFGLSICILNYRVRSLDRLKYS